MCGFFARILEFVYSRVSFVGKLNNVCDSLFGSAILIVIKSKKSTFKSRSAILDLRFIKWHSDIPKSCSRVIHMWKNPSFPHKNFLIWTKSSPIIRIRVRVLHVCNVSKFSDSFHTVALIDHIRFHFLERFFLKRNQVVRHWICIGCASCWDIWCSSLFAALRYWIFWLYHYFVHCFLERSFFDIYKLLQ